jgi:transposase
MGKNLTRSTLALAVVGAMSSFAMANETIETTKEKETTQLQTIVLTAEEQVKQSLGASIITDKDLEKLPVVNDISEYVRRMPGVNLTGNSATGQRGNNRQIDIRGMGPENTLILVDGKPVNSRNSVRYGWRGERDTRGDSNWVPADAIESIVRTPKNQYNTDMSYPIHFRKKILAKLEEGQSIRAVAQHFEINKNTIVEWKKRIEIKRTRPRKPSKVDDDALRADVEQYPDDYQYERAARFGCATSTIGDALKRLNITVKKRPYGTRKQKQNSESSI